MTLVFDVETTGKANFKLPADDATQPRLVQLGAILFDDDRRVMAEVGLIVKPYGYKISEEVSQIHGVTQSDAEEFGIFPELVLDLFKTLATRAHVLVAFNRQFDQFVIEGEFARMQIDSPFGEDQIWFDPMLESAPILKIPGNYGDWKWPKLSEAYRHFFGSDFPDAHTALGDVRATARIHWHLRDIKVAPPKKKV